MSLTSTMERVIPMTIYTVLKGEHREVEALFKTLNSTSSAMKGSREAVFGKLYRELMSHAKAEQETVYKRAEMRLTGQEVEHAKAEHKEIEQMLMTLKGMDVQSSEWESQLHKLQAEVERHVHEEEHEMFDHMRQRFEDDEVRDIAKDFREAKRAELKHMSTS